MDQFINYAKDIINSKDELKIIYLQAETKIFIKDMYKYILSLIIIAIYYKLEEMFCSKEKIYNTNLKVLKTEFEIIIFLKRYLKKFSNTSSINFINKYMEIILLLINIDKERNNYISLVSNGFIVSYELNENLFDLEFLKLKKDLKII